MKNLVSVLCSLMFLGLMSMSGDENVKSEQMLATLDPDCYTVHTVCDNAHPNDHDLFVICMQRNGCMPDDDPNQ